MVLGNSSKQASHLECFGAERNGHFRNKAYFLKKSHPGGANQVCLPVWAGSELMNHDDDYVAT
jgi:hypothetical protein